MVYEESTGDAMTRYDPNWVSEFYDAYGNKEWERWVSSLPDLGDGQNQFGVPEPERELAVGGFGIGEKCVAP